MDYLETLSGQITWIAGNLAYNLDFIPEDKLNWKPAPTANSALEVINHAVNAIKAGKNALATGAFEPQEFAPATNRDEAKQLLVSSAREYAQALATVKPEELGNTIQTRYGLFPKARIAMMPVVDLIHHHGQIAYIQTLLGDTDSHFDPALFQ